MTAVERFARLFLSWRPPWLQQAQALGHAWIRSGMPDMPVLGLAASLAPANAAQIKVGLEQSLTTIFHYPYPFACHNLP